MTDATTPRFRPIADSIWVVAAWMWGALAVVVGGARLRDEWQLYQLLRDVRSGSSGWYAYTSLPVEALTVLSLVTAAWVLISVLWLGAAVALAARRRLLATAVVVAVATAACGVLLYGDRERSGLMSLEPRLLTPAFVAAVVLMLDGVAALVISRSRLRGD